MCCVSDTLLHLWSSDYSAFRVHCNYLHSRIPPNCYWSLIYFNNDIRRPMGGLVLAHTHCTTTHLHTSVGDYWSSVILLVSFVTCKSLCYVYPTHPVLTLAIAFCLSCNICLVSSLIRLDYGQISVVEIYAISSYVLGLKHVFTPSRIEFWLSGFCSVITNLKQWC